MVKFSFVIILILAYSDMLGQINLLNDQMKNYFLTKGITEIHEYQKINDNENIEYYWEYDKKQNNILIYVLGFRNENSILVFDSTHAVITKQIVSLNSKNLVDSIIDIQYVYSLDTVITNYYYTKSNKIHKIVFYNLINNRKFLQQKIIYIYDEKENLITQIKDPFVFYGQSKIISYNYYKYDDDNRIISEFNNIGGDTSMNEYKYIYNEDGKLIIEREVAKDDVLSYNYYYNTKGFLIKEISNWGDDKDIIEYFYDSEDLLYQKEKTDKKNRKHIFTYKYFKK